jgi:hypothetical protein
MGDVRLRARRRRAIDRIGLCANWLHRLRSRAPTASHNVIMLITARSIQAIM